MSNSQPDPTLALDHVVIGVSDLEAAAQSLTRLLGRAPSWRGRHPLYGTANVLYRVGPSSAYLELLAPDPEATAGGSWTDHLKRFLSERGDGLFAIAFSTPDLASTLDAVRSRRLLVDDPAPGTGVDLMTGATRQWANARVPAAETGGTSFFFIEHRSPADALPIARPYVEAAAAASSVQAVSIETGDTAAATKLWQERVGLQRVSEGDGAWRFDLANARLLLYAGAGEAEAPHRWQRLVLGVPSLTALADRLDRDRVPFEQGDFKEGYGIRSDCCGADVLVVEAS